MTKVNSKVFILAYANDIDAFIPELWAQESLAILEENMVVGNLVHRDFSEMVAQYGDTVNTRKPAEFVGKRKSVGDSVTVQDATATNIPVKLDQHIHVSFMIKDGEESKSFKDLVQTYLQPALLAEARFLDQMILGQAIQFRTTDAGSLGTALTEAALIDLDRAFNDNKAPVDGRNLIVTSKGKADLLKIANFTTANASSDGGLAQRTAQLATNRYGFDIYMCQNASNVTAIANLAGKINNAAGYPIGTTTMTVDTFVGAVTTGAFILIGGRAYKITAHTESTGNTTSITIADGLRTAVADNDDITTIKHALVNNVANYAAGYDKEIVVDTIVGKITPGTPVAIGSYYYTAIQVTNSGSNTIGITLDRALEAAANNDDVVGVAPSGNYNFAFQRNAIALVTRPLAMPKQGAGALSAIAAYNGYAVRVVITYDGSAQGHLVTVDLLAGIKVLEPLKGGLLLG